MGVNYDPSSFIYRNSAKIWFDRQADGSSKYVVKAIWYVDKNQKYRTIIQEDASKPGGISTIVEKVEKTK